MKKHRRKLLQRDSREMRRKVRRRKEGKEKEKKRKKRKAHLQMLTILWIYSGFSVGIEQIQVALWQLALTFLVPFSATGPIHHEI